MTTLDQAQELLRKWRKAAGSACAGATLTPEKNGHLAELCWVAHRGLQRVWKQFNDPLTAVREAVKQTPWPDVGNSDGPMPLFTTETEEQLRAQLAERDARIGVLERKIEIAQTAARQLAAHIDGQTKRFETLRTKRDAALAKFRGLREFFVGLSSDLSVLHTAVQEALDRFPDEPSDPAQGDG